MYDSSTSHRAYRLLNLLELDPYFLRLNILSPGIYFLTGAKPRGIRAGGALQMGKVNTLSKLQDKAVGQWFN